LALDLTHLYNYDEFVPEKFERWMRFDESPGLGNPAPDFPLLTLEGNPVQLSEIWAAQPYTIVEFGSFT
jgi:hypothetical protein